MKKASSIFNIITMIFFIFIVVTFLVFGVMFSSNFDALVKAVIAKKMADTDAAAREIAIRLIVCVWVFMVIFIPPIVVAFIARIKLKKAKNKTELKVISVLSIIFLNILSGVFMLLIPEEEFQEKITLK